MLIFFHLLHLLFFALAHFGLSSEFTEFPFKIGQSIGHDFISDSEYVLVFDRCLVKDPDEFIFRNCEPMAQIWTVDGESFSEEFSLSTAVKANDFPTTPVISCSTENQICYAAFFEWWDMDALDPSRIGKIFSTISLVEFDRNGPIKQISFYDSNTAINVDKTTFIKFQDVNCDQTFIHSSSTDEILFVHPIPNSLSLSINQNQLLLTFSYTVTMIYDGQSTANTAFSRFDTSLNLLSNPVAKCHGLLDGVFPSSINYVSHIKNGFSYYSIPIVTTAPMFNDFIYSFFSTNKQFNFWNVIGFPLSFSLDKVNGKRFSAKLLSYGDKILCAFEQLFSPTNLYQTYPLMFGENCTKENSLESCRPVTDTAMLNQPLTTKDPSVMNSFYCINPSIGKLVTGHSLLPISCVLYDPETNQSKGFFIREYDFEKQSLESNSRFLPSIQLPELFNSGYVSPILIPIRDQYKIHYFDRLGTLSLFSTVPTSSPSRYPTLRPTVAVSSSTDRSQKSKSFYHSKLFVPFVLIVLGLSGLCLFIVFRCSYRFAVSGYQYQPILDEESDVEILRSQQPGEKSWEDVQFSYFGKNPKIISIYKGGFGSVFKITSSLDKKEYALKFLSMSSGINDIQFSQAWKNLSDEWEMVKTASKDGMKEIVEGHCIVKGKVPKTLWDTFACGPQNAIGFLMTYEKGGSLESLIHVNNTPLLPVVQFQFMIGIARGLCELHRRGIIHGDLKPSNVLITSNLSVKLADFGLSKMSPSVENVMSYQHSTFHYSNIPFKGTYLYAAPEMLITHHDPIRSEATRKTDIYSFALICYEILTGLRVYQGMILKVDEESSVAEVVKTQKARPPTANLRIDPGITSMIVSCWNERQNRPTADYCVSILESYLVQLVPKEFDVFISHCWVDNKPRPFVCEVQEQLQKLGYSVWMDVTHMGDTLTQGMLQAIRRSKVVLAFINRDYQKSDNCMLELNFAREPIPPLAPIPVVMIVLDPNPFNWLNETTKRYCGLTNPTFPRRFIQADHLKELPWKFNHPEVSLPTPSMKVAMDDFIKSIQRSFGEIDSSLQRN